MSDSPRVPTHPQMSEEVVLLDESAKPIGRADKYLIHNQSTPLHLAFSCYLFNDAGELLVTRRALSKLTWPGVWTNSFCGHPMPEEKPESAIERRAQQELGAKVHDIQLVLPDFRYQATDASGVVENEVCPVYTARISGTLTPNPEEVAQWSWSNVEMLSTALQMAPFAFSPWMVLQMPALESALGPNLTTQSGESTRRFTS